MSLARALFWGSLGALAWTHVGYPAAAGLLARLRPRPVRKGDMTLRVSVIVAAHDEEAVISRRVQNLLALDYPPERLEVVVVSDGSTDRTEEIVGAIARNEPRTRLLRRPHAGKTASQNAAVRETESEILAFSDANSVWPPDALAKLVRSFADADVAYVCGRVVLEPAAGANREGLYWRYETWLRAQESALGSITAGNGAIYAVRREDYIEQPLGHDFGLPYQLVKRGRRAVYEPEALAFEPPARDPEHEYRRKVRMFSRSWHHVLRGRLLEGVGPLYAFELVSHRVLRYSSGLLQLVLLGSSLALAGRGGVYRAAAVAQLAGLGLAVAGKARAPVPGASVAYYYFLVTGATLVGLARYLQAGPPVVWEKAEGTR